VSLDLDNALRVAHIAVMLLSVAVSVFLYLKLRDDKRFNEVHERMRQIEFKHEQRGVESAQEAQRFRERDADLDRRLSVAETKLDNVPSHEDLAALHASVHSVGTQVAAIDERSEQTLNTVSQIQEWLLRNR
jgi:hypothetical protein